MKYFYLYIFLISLFIFIMAYLNTYTRSTIVKESFTNNDTIVLLGDSIFKNDSYVSDGKSVEFLLKEKTNKKIYMYAENDALINDVYLQLNKLSIDLNSPSTTIFLSVGGNDILEKYVESSNENVPDDYIYTIFKSYKTLVKSIQTKMNKCNIVLVDIYYPNNKTYSHFKPLLEKWNNLLDSYASDKKNNIDKVIKISEVLTKPEDFTRDIEPSEIGGEKIAGIIHLIHL